MSDLLTFFDYYTQKLKWRVIPVLPLSKKPRFSKWNCNYDVVFTRNFLTTHDNYNLGLLLGDVVDLESDTKSGNALLSKCAEGYDHPYYRSGKSIHHLFLTPDTELTRKTIKDIEFRGCKHQSLLPPSVVEYKYEWLNLCEIPPLPSSLLNLYQQTKRKPLNPNYIKVKCSVCHTDEPIHKKRYYLEAVAFKELGDKWQCHHCRKFDVREMCRGIKKASEFLHLPLT
jgi:hypothetical protein